MKNRRWILYSIFCFFIINPLQPTICKGSENIDIYSYKVGNFDFIYYGRGYSYLIPHTAKSFINGYEMNRKLFDYDSKEIISVFVHDFSDYGNGGAITLPHNFVTLGINPFDNIYEIMPANERMQWLATHELNHIVVCDKAEKSDSFFRTIFFGKPINDNSNPLSMIYSYLATPRWYSPRWYLEGIAIFAETFMNGGYGRALGGYDEMVFRTMVLDSAYFYLPVGLETEGTTVDFKVGANAYLYGARFISYLADRHGVDKLLEFYNRSDSSSRFFATQFKNVYGNDLISEWKNWIDFENNYQNENLNRILENEITTHREITDIPLGSASRQFYDKNSNSIILAINYPGQLAHLAEINLGTGDIRKIAPVMSPRLHFVTAITYDEDSRTIFMTENNNNYRDLVLISRDNGKIIKKLDFQRFGDFAFNKADKSLWGIRVYNGRSILSRLLPPYDKIEEFYTLPFGNNLFDLDISRDGNYLSATYSTTDGNQKLVLFLLKDIIQGNNNFEVIYAFEGNSGSNFVFSEDGKYLYGTSYLTGVSNIFKINIESKDIEVISNTERGYFRPIPIGNDSLLAYSYTLNGMLPVILKEDNNVNANSIKFLGMDVLEKNPQLKQWNLPSISAINLDSIGVTESIYEPFTSQRLASIIPIVEGYKDFPSFGFRAKLMDKVFLSTTDLNISYSYNQLIPENERLHLYLKLKYWFWELTVAHNKTDFYDLFGPTKRSREGQFITIKYHDYIIQNRKPEQFEYSILGGAFFNLKTLPQYQNINTETDKLFHLAFNLKYNVLRKSLGAVEDEAGYDLNFDMTNDYVDQLNFFKVFTNASYGFLMPWRNSSLWLRAHGGKSFGSDDSPFNYFYFGAFGNNYLDNNEISRYRQNTSFPGVKINSIPGNTFAKGTFELNLAPVRFREFGFLPFYATYARLSLFAMALATANESIKSVNKFYNLGAQIDFEISTFYLLKTYLSFGYARAFSGFSKPNDEFMISLKF
ncbi:MAG: hypothetical protein M9949_12080 [Candidatus Kapabacteria bacterium]|nr:hypothetical protein [Candidatus Kapabacteria bacterium]